MDVRYSKLKIFHYPEKLNSLLPERPEIRPPVHVRIKPTNVCGHHCWYCAYRYDDLQLGKDINLREVIPRDRMMEIIDDLIEMGVEAVTFSGGGDPFYYPHLEEAARKLADSPIRFASLTNGARLEGEKADIFAHHASWVRISIDGWDAESYAKYRGVKLKEFDRVINNMRDFSAKKGTCRLGISLIVDKDNAAHVYEQVAMAKSVGAASIKVSPAIVSDHGDENNIYHEPFFDDVNAQVEQAKRDFEGEGFEVYHAYHRQEVVFDKGYHWCPYLQVLCVIGADLRVYACQDKAYNLDSGLLGSIQNMRFKDFWMSDKNKFFTIDPSRDCNHHCVADGKNKLVLEYLGAAIEHREFV